jgi:hypothetical protein
MAEPLHLLARDNFKAGDMGYATAKGVSVVGTGFVPVDGFMVRALEDIDSGKNGKFQELERKQQ